MGIIGEIQSVRRPYLKSSLASASLSGLLLSRHAYNKILTGTGGE